jgi:hypothetical protein
VDLRIPDLAERLGPPPDFLRHLKPTPADVDELERATGAQLPSEYRELLLELGCGELLFGVLRGPDPDGDVLLRDGDAFGADVYAFDRETNSDPKPTGLDVVDFVSRTCLRRVNASVDVTDVADEQELLAAVWRALAFRDRYSPRWDTTAERLRSLVLDNRAVTLEVQGWAVARERIGDRAGFLPEVFAECGATLVLA